MGENFWMKKATRNRSREMEKWRNGTDLFSGSKFDPFRSPIETLQKCAEIKLLYSFSELSTAAS
jgi:hypothetical protein